MGLFGPSKKERALQEEVEALKSQLLPEQKELLMLQEQIKSLTQQKATLEDDLAQQREEFSKKNDALSQLEREITNKKGLLYSLTDDIELQEYGLYQPTYEFSNSDYAGDNLPFLKGTESRKWLGINWIMHTGLPLDGTNRDCFIFHKTAAPRGKGSPPGNAARKEAHRKEPRERATDAGTRTSAR